MARCRRGGVPQGGTPRSYLLFCYLFPKMNFHFCFYLPNFSYVGSAHGHWCSSVGNSVGLDNDRLNGRFGIVDSHGQNSHLFSLFKFPGFADNTIVLSIFYQPILLINRDQRMGACGLECSSRSLRYFDGRTPGRTLRGTKLRGERPRYFLSFEFEFKSNNSFPYYHLLLPIA